MTTFDARPRRRRAADVPADATRPSPSRAATRAGTRRSTPSSVTTAAAPSTTWWPACRASDPRVVVDLGCGPGDLTLTLADRWPGARVVGVDSSPEMLARARETDRAGPGGVGRDRRRDVGPHRPRRRSTCSSPTPPSSGCRPTCACCPAGWSALAPGGVLAMQVPANFDAPSHRLMREVAARHPRADDLRAGLDRADAVARPETYAALLLAHTREVDVWQTTYLQVLAAEPDGAAPGARVGAEHGPAPGARRADRRRGARGVPRHLRG